VVPRLAAAGLTEETWPPSMPISAALSLAAVRERIESLAIDPIEGSASPRKPSERISWMSSASFEVQWRAMASASSFSEMPLPSSVTRLRF
jgi:hypothetical protein